MYGSSSSFGSSHGGPASTWSTSTPGASGTRGGRSGSSRRVWTTTSSPRRPRVDASAATCTFCPPASTPPSTASGLACSETIAILMRSSPPEAARPSRRRSAAGRSARAPRRGDQHVDLGGDDTRRRRDRLVHLGRPERDDRHAQVHRLQQREPERGPADRVHVHAPARKLRVHPLLRQVFDPAEGGGVDAEEVERRGLAEAIEQVGAGHARAPARLVDHGGAARQLAAVALAGVDDPVLDHARGRRAGVPEERVEVRDVDEQEVVAVGRRVAHLRDPPLRRVVLHVHGRDVAAGPAAEPVLGQPLELVRALQHDGVEVLVVERLGRQLAHALARRVVRPRDADAVGPAVRDDRDDVVVLSVDEGGRPRAMHVPQQDPHATASSAAGASRSTAPTTSSTVIAPRHGCPSTGQTRARQPAHGTSAYSSSCGTRHGRQRTAGTVGANSETTGVPTAAARCAGPVLPTTTQRAAASTSASSARLVRPPRSVTRSDGGPATNAVRLASPGAPVTTTGRPVATSACTSSALRSGAQARAGAEAPGCTTTYPRVSSDAPMGSTRRHSSRRIASAPSSPGGTGKPAAAARSSERSTSCTSSPIRWRTSSSEPG